MKFIWSCAGFDLRSSLNEPVDTIMEIVSNHVDKIKKSIGDSSGEEWMRQNGGAVLQRLVVELRAKNIRVSIEVEPGHIMQHVCGRIYLPSEWGSLDIKPITLKNGAGDGSARMPTRLCGCGEYVGYDGMCVTHAENVCNTRQARGAAN